MKVFLSKNVYLWIIRPLIFADTKPVFDNGSCFVKLEFIY